MKKDDTSKKRKLPTIDHGIDIIGDEWENEKERMEKEEFFKKELEECCERGIEISQECKTYYKKKFEWGEEKPLE